MGQFSRAPKGWQKVDNGLARRNPAMFEFRRTLPSGRGQPVCKLGELVEIECDRQVNVACETPKVSNREEQRGSSDNDEVSPEFITDFLDHHQIGDLVRG